MFKRKKGFTLIELVVASILFVIVAGAIYFSFANYKKMAKKDELKTRLTQDLRAALDILNHDISQAGYNAMKYGVPAFVEIDNDKIILNADLYPQFPTHADYTSGITGSYETITYTYNAGTKTLRKQVRRGGTVYRDVVLLRNIKKFRFRYFTYVNGTVKEMTNLPQTAAVDKIDLTLKFVKLNVETELQEGIYRESVSLYRSFTPKNLQTMNPSNLTCRPDNVTNVSVSQAECFGFKFRWRWPSSGGCPVSGLRIKYKDELNNDHVIDIGKKGHNGYDDYTISAGFVNGHAYEFKFSTYTYGGRECYSSQIITKTATLSNPVLRPPSNLNAQLTSTGDINLTWTPSPDVSNSKFSQYILKFGENEISIPKTSTSYLITGTGYCVNWTIELLSQDVCGGLSAPVTTTINTVDEPLPTITGLTGNYISALDVVRLTWNLPATWFLLAGVKVEFKPVGGGSFTELPPPYPAYDDPHVTTADIPGTLLGGSVGNIIVKITPYSLCQENTPGTPTTTVVTIEEEQNLAVPATLTAIVVNEAQHLIRLEWTTGFLTAHPEITAMQIAASKTGSSTTYSDYSDQYDLKGDGVMDFSPAAVDRSDLSGDYVYLKVPDECVNYYFALKTKKGSAVSIDFVNTTTPVFINGCCANVGDAVTKQGSVVFSANEADLLITNSNSESNPPEPDGLVVNKIFVNAVASKLGTVETTNPIFNNTLTAGTQINLKGRHSGGKKTAITGSCVYGNSKSVSTIDFDSGEPHKEPTIANNILDPASFDAYFNNMYNKLQSEGKQVLKITSKKGELDNILGSMSSFNYNNPVFVFLAGQDTKWFRLNLQELKGIFHNSPFNITFVISGKVVLLYNDSYTSIEDANYRYDVKHYSYDAWNSNQSVAVIAKGRILIDVFWLWDWKPPIFNSILYSSEKILFKSHKHYSYIQNGYYGYESYYGSPHKHGLDERWPRFEMYGSMSSKNQIAHFNFHYNGRLPFYQKTRIYYKDLTSNLIGLPTSTTTSTVPINITGILWNGVHYNSPAPSQNYTVNFDDFCIKDNQTYGLKVYFDDNVQLSNFSLFTIEFFNGSTKVGTITIK